MQSHLVLLYSLYIAFIFVVSSTVKPLRKVIVSGASGYIGRNVVRELVSRQVETIALIRKGGNIPDATMNLLAGAKIVYCNVLDPLDVAEAYKLHQPTATICCLASRSGVPKDAWDIDYLAGYNTLQAFVNQDETKEAIMKNFVLLSAYCCGKPLLQFQHAKLKLEEAIRTSPITHSIVRPTAFFKSIDGQLESARNGNPIFLFGDGSCSSNPICEKDLAKFLVDSALETTKVNMVNCTRSIGGPDVPPVTKREQAELIFNALNIESSKRKIFYLPLSIFNILISFFSTTANTLRILNIAPRLLERFEDATELARIVRYYAVEPMIAIGPDEIQGTRSIKDHFDSVAARGGKLEEIDPMTTTAGVLSVFAENTYYNPTTIRATAGGALADLRTD